MGVHIRGVWLCYSVLIVWCATVAVCSPVAQRPVARKRVTYPKVVTEPTTVEPAADEVADRAPIDSSKNNGITDETATLPPEDTSSPLFVSLDDGLMGSTDSTNGTFNDTADLEDDTTSSEPADVDGVHSSGGILADNLKFACEDVFLREVLALSKEDCAGVMMSWSDDAQNEEKSEAKHDEQSEEHYEEQFEDQSEEQSEELEEPHYDH